jgi:hypothetical protein
MSGAGVRFARRRRRTGAPAVAAAALAALAVVVASCGVAPEPQAHVFRSNEVPSGILDRVVVPTTTTSGPSTTQAALTSYRLFFVRSGALHEATRTSTGLPAASDLVEELSEGPTVSETATGFRSALGTANVVSAVRLNGALAQVDLARTFADIPRLDQSLAIGQITLTLTDRTDIVRVQFTMANLTIDVPKGDGSLTHEPVGAEDFRELIRLPTTTVAGGPGLTATGATGATGAAGATGATGASGATGGNGASGSTVASAAPGAGGASATTTTRATAGS